MVSAIRSTVEYLRTELPSFDLMTGGGIPKGRMFEVYGDPDVGKSTLAFHLLRSAQRYGRVMYIDFEDKLDDRYMYSLGVDAAKLDLVLPEYGEMGLNASLDMLDKEVEVIDAIAKEAGNKRPDKKKLSSLRAKLTRIHTALIVFDSVAEITPLKELKANKLEDDNIIGLQARLMSQFCRVVGWRLNKTGAAIMGINQARDVIGGFGARPDSPGGRAWKHKCGIRVHCTRKKSEFYPDGGLLRCWRIKNNINNSPVDRAEFHIGRGVGIDIPRDYATVAERFGILKKKGHGTWTIGQKEFRGRYEAAQALVGSPAFVEFLETGAWDE